MQRTTKKLALARQTLRSLTPAELGGVGGGELEPNLTPNQVTGKCGIWNQLSNLLGTSCNVFTGDSFDDPNKGKTVVGGR